MEGKKELCREINCPFAGSNIKQCSYKTSECIDNLPEYIRSLSEAIGGLKNDSNETILQKGLVAYIKSLQYKDGSNHEEGKEIDKATLLKIMNECIQRGTDRRTVCHYVIESGEMSRMEKGDELHILTNEFKNYDFTPMSSLAIAINTKNGIHYYYYGTADQERKVKELKERIKTFYCKSFKARQSVTCWIRQAKGSIYDYNEFLSPLCGTSISKIIESIIYGSNIDNKNACIQTILEKIQTDNDKSGEERMPARALLNKVLEWIGGKSFSDEGSIYEFIDNFGILISAIKSDTKLMTDSAIKEFCNKIQLLLDMKELTVWQTKSDYEIDKDKIEYLFQVFRYKDETKDARFNEIISDPVRNWLKPQEGEVHCGQINCTESDLENWANNIHFFALNNEAPYILCYSFTLFFSDEEPAAAWYTTYKDNGSSDSRAMDNDLFMIDFAQGDVLLDKLKQAFKTLIENHLDIKTKLQALGSRITSFLNIQ